MPFAYNIYRASVLEFIKPFEICVIRAQYQFFFCLLRCHSTYTRRLGSLFFAFCEVILYSFIFFLNSIFFIINLIDYKVTIIASLLSRFFPQMPILVLLLSLSSLVVNADVVCPSADVIEPCNCTEYPNKPDIAFLECPSRNVNDLRASEILDAFLTTPGVSPFVGFNLWGNRLTRVPDQTKLFDQLIYVFLNNGNSITSIELGTFNFPDAANPLQWLWLQDNQVTTIAPGAFKGLLFLL